MQLQLSKSVSKRASLLSTAVFSTIWAGLNSLAGKASAATLLDMNDRTVENDGVYYRAIEAREVTVYSDGTTAIVTNSDGTMAKYEPGEWVLKSGSLYLNPRALNMPVPGLPVVLGAESSSALVFGGLATAAAGVVGVHAASSYMADTSGESNTNDTLDQVDTADLRVFQQEEFEFVEGDGASSASFELLARLAETGAKVLSVSPVRESFGTFSISDDGLRLGYSFHDNQQADALQEGEKEIDFASLNVAYGNGETATRTLSVTVTGTNDAPIVLTQNAEFAFTSGLETSHDLQPLFNDPDLKDILNISSPNLATGLSISTGNTLESSSSFTLANPLVAQTSEIELIATDNFGATAQTTATIHLGLNVTESDVADATAFTALGGDFADFFRDGDDSARGAEAKIFLANGNDLLELGDRAASFGGQLAIDGGGGSDEMTFGNAAAGGGGSLEIDLGSDSAADSITFEGSIRQFSGTDGTVTITNFDVLHDTISLYAATAVSDITLTTTASGVVVASVGAATTSEDYINFHIQGEITASDLTITLGSDGSDTFLVLS